ncbi:hypothetical protein ASPVEDRAFT_25765 [Aspergillus versicolor CBS 583.65]|uniref:LITAF domain-containing protein n=1 Tax=Aspergillus versicolor CBS 583.65 TaxID=1036611 RepID=A0A1L9PBL4_ASPVE|nr:uncharacterized protein ASPVEDRAFT_25765 [Aspergillus versicolor CBS 583.65]OJI98920.1 hypothetical protein ASPVEDRAFT_25765 [Aspergillus versicolor CBS 583.65]
MAEKANYPPELQAASPPTYEQPPTIPQQAHPGTPGPGAELHLEQMPPQGYAPAPQQVHAPQGYPPQQAPQGYVQTPQQSPQAYAAAPQQAPGPWNPTPQMYPPQQYAAPAPAPAQNNYPTAIPLHALGRTSQVVDCPMCHTREMTRTEAVNGSTTHAWAAVLCCCACVGCIPYFMAHFKDVEHKCGKCNYLLATYHGSGHVVVHQQTVQPVQQQPIQHAQQPLQQPVQGQPIKQ